MNKKSIIGLALAGAMATSAAVMAAITFDPETGTGFVGKGDVQLVYGWNNKALQDNADYVEFRVSSESETSWTCTKPRPDHPQGDMVQERNRTTTLQGLFDEVARDTSRGKNGPVTGFNLLSYDGNPVNDTDGPPVGSCPANPSGFVYDENAVTTELGGGVQVKCEGGPGPNCDGVWKDLQ